MNKKSNTLIKIKIKPITVVFKHKKKDVYNDNIK